MEKKRKTNKSLHRVDILALNGNFLRQGKKELEIVKKAMENYAFIFPKYEWQFTDDKEKESQESYRTNMLPCVEDLVVYRPTPIPSLLWLK